MQLNFVDATAGAHVHYVGVDGKRAKMDEVARDMGPLTAQQRRVAVRAIRNSSLGSSFSDVVTFLKGGGSSELLEAAVRIGLQELHDAIRDTRDSLISLADELLEASHDSMLRYAAQRLGGHIVRLIDEAALDPDTCRLDLTQEVRPCMWRMTRRC